MKRAASLAIALLLGSAPAGAQGEAKVEFETPRHLQTVLGPSEIVLTVTVPDGLEAERVEIRVDDAAIATLERPPWRTSWDAGPGRGHHLEAILRLSNGTEVRSSIRTSPLRITYVEEVALVNLYAVVRDASGDYVTDLDREDFTVTENGRPQRIQRFTTERKPLRVALVLDSSLTMEGPKLERAREAALKFLDVLGEGDQGMVVTFSDGVRVAQELTDDRAALERAIQAVEAKGGTALYDAVWKTARKLREYEGRRVLVLLSDGRDEASSGLEPGSLHTLSEALDRALRDEVIVFAIGIGRNLDEQPDFYRRRTLQSILEEMAVKTGGRALFPRSAGRLKSAFEDVANDLRHMYAIAYVSDDQDRDGAWREIRLETSRRNTVVYTRRGYFAPSNGGGSAGVGSF